jgi:dihydrofolate reductase
MKLTVTTFSTLDGVMQGPAGAEEDTANGFRFGGWLLPFADAENFGAIARTFEQADEFLLGHTTYSDMQKYWSQVTDSSDVVAKALNTLPKHVATRNPGTTLTWANSHAIRGDVVEAVRALKARPGRELQVHGSHGLIQTLLGTGLVDQFNVLTFPLVVGTGKRLFGARDAAFSLKLLSSEVTPKGIIVARYETTGALVPGEQSLQRGQP